MFEFTTEVPSSQVDRGVEDDLNEDDQNEDNRQQRRRHPRIYIGQTGRSIHSRIQEHQAGVRNDIKNCPLKKHVDLCHNGDRDQAKFETGILHGARTNLSRLILEGEEIQAHSDQGLLNSKSEFRATKIIRLVTDRKNF